MASARISRSGLLYSDDEILAAMNAGFDPKFLGGARLQRHHKRQQSA